MNAVARTHRGVVEVALPIRTISEANARSHWAAKARRVASQRGPVALRLRGPLAPFRDAMAVSGHAGAKRPARGNLAPVIGMSETRQVAVTLTRVAPSNGLDDDNLRGALKAVRDGVADALGVDDRDPRVEWKYAQKRGKYGVVVKVEGK